VFDEMRYFRPGEGCPVYVIAGVGVGVNVCEDIWYPGEPTRAQAQAGAQVIVNINGSPYHTGKREFRQQMLATRAGDYGVFVCYTNQVGGQDELVFDGGSMVLSPEGELIAQAAMFEEELLVCDLDLEGPFRRTSTPARQKAATGKCAACRSARRRSWPRSRRSSRGCSRRWSARRRSTPRSSPAAATTCARPASRR
jgi:NAD+ synthase (glutamine-hydrolysing)